MEEIRMVNMKEVCKKINSLELTGFDPAYDSFYFQVNGFELTGSEREYMLNYLGCVEHDFKAPRKRRFYLPPGVKLIQAPFGQ